MDEAQACICSGHTALRKLLHRESVIECVGGGGKHHSGGKYRSGGEYFSGRRCHSKGQFHSGCRARADGWNRTGYTRRKRRTGRKFGQFGDTGGIAAAWRRGRNLHRPIWGGEGSQTLAILIGSETVDASYTAEISRAEEFCFTLVPREGAQIKSVTAQGAEIEKVEENEYVLRQITEEEVTIVVETVEGEEGAQTEELAQTEVPQDVKAFLDAAAALPSAGQITPENAKKIGEEVKAALEKVNAVHEAVQVLLGGEEEESSEIPYYLYVAHSLDLDGKLYGATEIIRLEKEDFRDDAYDLHQNIMQKEGMEEAKASYLDNETYDLTEGWTVHADDFEEAGDPEDGSNYYGMYALIEYQVAEGYNAVVSDNPTPVDDPYGVMLLIGLTGSNLVDVTFEPAKLITVTVEYMFSPTGGLRGTHAADTQKYQVEVPAQGETTKTWDLPNENDGNNPGLEGFRIVLDPGPLNEYLVNPELANRADEGTASDAEIQNALENDYFTVDTANKTVYEWQERGETPPESYDDYPTNANYHNRYSSAYNQAWESARKITPESGNLISRNCYT